MSEEKTTINSIWDTSNTNDLPDALKKELRLHLLNGNDQTILDLFEEKNHLGLDEILIALYRKHKIIRRRTWAANNLSALAHKNKIMRIGRGLYKKYNNAKD